MNLRKLLAEKRSLDETKSNLKISKLRPRKPKGLQVVKAAEPCDPDVLDFLDKTREFQISRGAPLTQRLKIEIKKAA